MNAAATSTLVARLDWQREAARAAAFVGLNKAVSGPQGGKDAGSDADEEEIPRTV